MSYNQPMNYAISSFSRNRRTSVEQIDENTLKSTCILQDTLTDAIVEILVQLPDLEIIGAKGEFRRTFKKECQSQNESLQKVLGVRIGPGMLKIIKGLMSEITDCQELIYMVEECCHGVILTYTKESLLERPKNIDNIIEFYKKMVKENVRLYNRCAAFAPGSPIVEDIDQTH